MTPDVDLNVVYPVGSTIVIVVGAIIGLKYFATNSDLKALETTIAEKYMLKEDADRMKDDTDKKIEDMKTDMRLGFTEIKTSIQGLYGIIADAIKGK